MRVASLTREKERLNYERHLAQMHLAAAAASTGVSTGPPLVRVRVRVRVQASEPYPYPFLPLPLPLPTPTPTPTEVIAGLSARASGGSILRSAFIEVCIRGRRSATGEIGTTRRSRRVQEAAISVQPMRLNRLTSTANTVNAANYY